MARSHAKRLNDTLKELFSKENIWLTVLKLIAVSLAFAVVLVAVYFSSFFYSYEKEKENLKYLKGIWNSRTSISNGLQKLKAENEDICGWIEIENTEINYPVLKNKKLQYYENHNSRKKKSRLGAVHFANECNLTENAISQNLCISAKNLKNSLMFGDLKKFRDIDFVKTYPEIILYLGNNEYKYTVFSVCVTDSLSNEDKFDYKDADLKNYALYKGQAYNRSLFNIPIEINTKSKILTLVTDTFDFNGAKLVVSAKLRNGANSVIVDSAPITVNKNAEHKKSNK